MRMPETLSPKMPLTGDLGACSDTCPAAGTGKSNAIGRALVKRESSGAAGPPKAFYFHGFSDLRPESTCCGQEYLTSTTCVVSGIAKTVSDAPGTSRSCAEEASFSSVTVRSADGIRPTERGWRTRNREKTERAVFVLVVSSTRSCDETRLLCTAQHNPCRGAAVLIQTGKQLN